MRLLAYKNGYQTVKYGVSRIRKSDFEAREGLALETSREEH
jgi:hypothetical protein